MQSSRINVGEVSTWSTLSMIKVIPLLAIAAATLYISTARADDDLGKKILERAEHAQPRTAQWALATLYIDRAKYELDCGSLGALDVNNPIISALMKKCSSDMRAIDELIKKILQQ